MAPENDEAAIWLATVATATAGAMPTKINSGVIRNPPPMPNMPDTKPTAAPIARMRKTLTGMSAIGRYSCTRVTPRQREIRLRREKLLSERGPIAASLHNRNRPSEGLKNPLADG